MAHEQQGGWRKDLAPYERPRTRSSVWQILNTFIPFVTLWYAAYLGLSISYWITLALGIAAGGFLVRIFIIFHDCCHKSFFKNKTANDIIGTLTGILTFCPYYNGGTAIPFTTPRTATSTSGEPATYGR